MALELYDGPYTGAEVDNRLSMERAAYTGNTGGSTVITSGSTANLTNVISLEDDSHYYFEAFGQLAFVAASDDAIDVAYANVDFGIAHVEGVAAGTFSTFSASGTASIDTGLGTTSGVVKFSGYLDTGTSPTVQFQLSPASGNALAYVFCANFYKIFDTLAA